MELYVHIPFCRKKCRYCAFVSYADKEAEYENYIGLILDEAGQRHTEANEPVTTVYIGGGTPSLLPSALLSALVRGLDGILDLGAVKEFTVEANPGTVTAEWMDAAAALGVNRLSFGMQARQDRLLHLLGRIHQFEEVAASVQLARRAGITNLNLDLIFGIPAQTMAEWEETLDAALSLNPSHLSAYGLIPEEGTPLCEDLEQGRLSLPDPDTERKMYDTVKLKTAEQGLFQYEVSTFARPGSECMHNIGYWTQVPYLGLGVSAASMTGVHSGKAGFTCVRSVNPDTLEAYEDAVRNRRRPASELIRPPEARFETMMLGLRMNRGVSERDFARMHRVPLDQCYGEKMRMLE